MLASTPAADAVNDVPTARPRHGRRASATPVPPAHGAGTAAGASRAFSWARAASASAWAALMGPARAAGSMPADRASVSRRSFSRASASRRRSTSVWLSIRGLSTTLTRAFTVAARVGPCSRPISQGLIRSRTRRLTNQTTVNEAENYATQQGARSSDGAIEASNGDYVAYDLDFGSRVAAPSARALVQLILRGVESEQRRRAGCRKSVRVWDGWAVEWDPGRC